MSGIDNNGVAYLAGLDVGSTTVKAVVVDVRTDQIVWRDYQRHETRQPEKLLDFLRDMESEAGITPGNCRVFITGSGGNSLAGLIGAKFVQEVNAVSLAVEKLHPEVNSVVELGGQDAKIIILKDDVNHGRKRKIPSMNDKCAGGTGAVIDKIVAKLKIPYDELGELGYNGIKLHHVAGKCGVFAETDINSLQKQGVPAEATDGFAVRCHRFAESDRPDARTHPAAARFAAGWAEQFYSRHARGLAAQHSARVETARTRVCRRRPSRRSHQGSRGRSVLCRHRRRGVWQG